MKLLKWMPLSLKIALLFSSLSLWERGWGEGRPEKRITHHE
jgi:hypothetical protein